MEHLHKKISAYRLISIGLAIALIISVIFLFSPAHHARLLWSKIAAEQAKSDTPLINPLRKFIAFKALRPFGPELETLIEKLKAQGYASEIAVYFRSLNDGVWIGIGEKTLFAPASLMKVPMMILYLKEAETNPAVLKQQLTITKGSNFNQYVASKVNLDEKRTYSVQDLIEIMIKDSNNDALLTLSRNANSEIGMKMYRQLGYTTTFQDTGDFLSLKSYVGTFRVLYNATFLNEKMSNKALDYLVRTDFDRGIAAGVPKEIKVANKFGEYLSKDLGLKQLHDVGIVYHHDNPYILGIMTRGDNFMELESVIKEISSFIYNEVNRQYKKQDEEQDFFFEFEAED